MTPKNRIRFASCLSVQASSSQTTSFEKLSLAIPSLELPLTFTREMGTEAKQNSLFEAKPNTSFLFKFGSDQRRGPVARVSIREWFSGIERSRQVTMERRTGFLVATPRSHTAALSDLCQITGSRTASVVYSSFRINEPLPHCRHRIRTKS